MTFGLASFVGPGRVMRGHHTIACGACRSPIRHPGVLLILVRRLKTPAPPSGSGVTPTTTGLPEGGRREKEMVMVMEKVTRHLLTGDRTLDLWT